MLDSRWYCPSIIFLYMILIMARQQVVLSQHYLPVHEPDFG
jgi:hypothetical protein